MSADAPAFSARDVDDLAGPPPEIKLPTPPPIDPPTPDTAPKAAKRPTTRAGRRAAAAANAAKNGGAPKAPSDKAPKASAPTPRKATLETRLTNQLVGIGTVVAATGAMLGPAYTADGVLIIEHSANVAKALDKVAQDQPQVKAALERMLTAGVWSGLAAAVLPLAVGIAANHGALPAGVAAMLGAQAPAADQAPQGGGVESIHLA